MTFKQIALAMTVTTASVHLPSGFAEQVPGTNLSVHFESGTIIGSGRNINVHRIPVVDLPTNTTVYYDATFQFRLDGNNALVFERISSVAVSLPLPIENFIAGTYQDTLGNKYILSGPSVLGDGRTGWALSAAPDSGNYAVSWITGSSVGHPSVGNTEVAADLPSGYAFGLQGTNDHIKPRKYWYEGLIIAAQQIGDTIVLSRFHSSSSARNMNTPNASFNLSRVIE